MKIVITKKQHRSRLVCTRADGSFALSDLGPNLPHHDLAHYVAETTLQLRRGFFGNIAGGYTVEQLSTKEVILALGREAWIAEVVARALGSLAAGACTLEQFPSLVTGELTGMKIKFDLLPGEVVASMAKSYRQLLDRFAALPDGQSLELNFETSSANQLED